MSITTVERAEPGALRRRVTGSPYVPVALLVGSAVWALWRTGVSRLPNIAAHEAIARTWPHSPVPPSQGYILRSPVGMVLYRELPFRGLTAYAVLHATVLVIAYLALTAWFLRELGWHRGLAAASVLVLSPITAVLMLWVGSYDAFTMLAWVAVLWSMRGSTRTFWGLQFAAGIFLGVQNAEQGIAGLLLLWLIRPFVTRAQLAPRPVAALAGCLVGKVVLEGYLHSVGAVSGSRVTWLTDWSLLEPTLSTSVKMFPVILWSGLCGLWLFVALLPRPRWTPAVVIRLVGALALWFGVALFGADHTRVLAITSVLVVVLAVRDIMADRLPTIGAVLRAPAFWVLALASPTVVWLQAILPHG